MKGNTWAWIIAAVLVIAALGWYIGMQVKKPAVPNINSLTSTLIATTHELVSGKWQSKDDAKFIRTIFKDGTFDDVYDGKSVSQGIWTTFIKETPDPEFKMPYADRTIYMKLKDQASTLFFVVASTSNETTLDLTNLEKGSSLSFTKIGNE